MLHFSFSRNERLKSRKTIGLLFTEGKSFIAYPLRVVWMPIDHPHEDAPPVQMAVSVSKRFFKSAVQRNRIKRLIRESYRLHKHELYDIISESGQPPVAMMLIYLAKEPLPQQEVEEGVRKLLAKWKRESGEGRL